MFNTQVEHRFWRSTGTFASVVEFVWRYWYYFQTYSKVAQPFTIFLFTTATIVDLIYPFVYVSVSRKEKKKSK
jgi:paspaline synthase